MSGIELTSIEQAQPGVPQAEAAEEEEPGASPKTEVLDTNKLTVADQEIADTGA